MMQTHQNRAEVRLSTADLTADIGFFSKVLGMRMDRIYPADDPSVATLSGHGLQLRLDRAAHTTPGDIIIATDDKTFADGATQLTSPGGTQITIEPLNPPLIIPDTDTSHQFLSVALRIRPFGSLVARACSTAI